MARREKDAPYRARVTHYKLPDGTRCNKSTPGAVKHTTETRTYYGNVGGKRHPLDTTDLGQAWERLRELHRREALGLPLTWEAPRTLEQHRQDWLASVRDSGAGTKRQLELATQIAGMLRETGWQTVGDITAESCLAALGRLARREGHSAATRNHYLTATKQFARWLRLTGRMVGSPLDLLRLLNEEADRRLVHRLPTTEEIAQLLTYLEGGQARRRRGTHRRGPELRMAAGRHRALAYKVALYAGLRANEVRTLERGAFALDTSPPTVTVEAEISKHRQQDTLPLPDWLAGELRAWFDAGGPTFAEAMPNANGCTTMLRADLDGAGIAYDTPKGQFTWHSFRVWAIDTWASDPLITPKRLFDLARHADPKLTMRTYAKARISEEAEAVNRMPRPGAIPPPP